MRLLTLKRFSNISDDVIVYKGECDHFRGNNSFQTITYIKCKGDTESDVSQCDKIAYTKKEKCENLPECKPDDIFGPWTCWSECSRTCIERVDEPSTRTRSRVCKDKLKNQNQCSGQMSDTEDCIVPKCADKGKYIFSL